jgi:MYXO-CTERM domain-containing protein
MPARRPVVLASIAMGLVAAPQVAHAAPTESLTNPLIEASNCTFCHDFENPVAQIADPPVSPYRSWQGSMMANAARDPVFWAGIGVADQDAPGTTDLCIRCHSPRAFVEGNGAATTIDELTPQQQAGVECELCHRAMEDPGVPAGNAAYTLDDTLVNGVVPRRGPWDFTDGVEVPPHPFLTDGYLGTSRLCGTCHDVTTSAERVDDMGNGLGVPFNEQRTYREWTNSAYGTPGPDFASCQDCHMPALPDVAGCFAHSAQGITHATGGRRHDLLGANRFMIGLLKQEYGSAGANTVFDIYYDNAMAQMANFLQTAASLDVVTPSEVDLAAGLDGITVTVTNNTGHKLPSGYSEGRVMWIEVLGTYDGEVVYSSGAWDQTAGIEQDPQLHTYEAIGEEWATGTEFHLLLNNHWVVDSRIPPLGLLPDMETDPVGDRYELQMDGTWPNFDEHSYAFDGLPDLADATPADPDDDVLELTVRLRYLINTPEYVDFLAGSGTEAGNHVGMLFDTAGGSVPEILVEQTLAIPITGFGAVAGTTGGATTSGGASTTSGGATTGVDSTASDPTTVSGDGTGAETSATGSTTTGEAADDGDGGGCGCRSGGTGGSVLWMLPFGLVGLRRRRKRPANLQRSM